MPKLKAITFLHTPKIPGLRAGDLGTIDCAAPASTLRGWRALVRGPMLFLVSPPGWAPGRNARDAAIAPSDPCSIHQVPLNQCFLHWEGSDGDVDKVAKYTSEPFGPPPEVPEPSLLSQLPPEQMGDA